jgi:hypothetical protein
MRSARNGPVKDDVYRKRKLRWISAIDRVTCELHGSRHAQNLRKFGEPPKIRRLLPARMRYCRCRALVILLILWTFPTRRTARHALACFLRGNKGEALSCRTADCDRKTFSLISNLIAFSIKIVAPTQTKENRHETCHHLAISAGRLRRPEHAASERRRRLRCRRIPGRLRRGGTSCRCRCAASRRCRPASDCRAPQGILIFVRCILLAIALAAVLASIVPTGLKPKIPPP